MHDQHHHFLNIAYQEAQIAFEKNAQLEQYSTIYFKKINRNSIISEK